ncbi:MAG: hypothetical protein A2X94_12465 [Bdellovibrionales bacterium GWB1_55_8]|nr:MAG: hypothetical protein A2X94_12465 [Bdellovibrionales bacterium GWB1_55_8]
MRQRQRSFYLFNNATRRFIDLTDGFTCGRTEGDFQLPSDELVSKRQCRFSIHKNVVSVEDLGATNPTKVNTVPLQPKRARKLYLNDVIEFGRCRLILTNTNTSQPANTQDRFGPKRPLRAARKSDGSLTSDISGFFTKTIVLLTPKSYRSLRIKEFSEGRGWDSSTFLTGLVILGGWIAALGLAHHYHAALGNLASLAGITLLLKELVLGSLVALLFVFAHYYLIRRTVRGAFRRLLFIPLWVFVASLAVASAAVATGLFSELEENVIAHYCIDNFDAGRCAIVTRELPAFGQFPEVTQKTIRERLERAAR